MFVRVTTFFFHLGRVIGLAGSYPYPAPRSQTPGAVSSTEPPSVTWDRPLGSDGASPWGLSSLAFCPACASVVCLRPRPPPANI